MSGSLLIRLIAKVLALALIVGLGALMLGPFEVIEQASQIPDYVAHAVAFFLIMICLSILVDGRFLVASALVAVVLGGGVELIQGRIGRDPSWSDFGADIVGTTTATLMLALLRLLIATVQTKP